MSRSLEILLSKSLLIIAFSWFISDRRMIMASGFEATSLGGAAGRPRRSKRLRDRQDFLRRSSSLGEESDVDHFDREATCQDPRRLSATRLFSIGLIADIQYAPIPDGVSYAGIPRYYRHSLEAARAAARHFEREKVRLVVNLGDIVDGKCQDIARNGGVPFPEGSDPGREAVNHVLDALAEYRSGPVLHAYGNHCLYNLDRPSLAQMLGIRFVEEPCGDLVGYGAHREGGVHFLTLDTYDVAKMRRCETGSLKHRRAVELLEANNPNYPAQENSPEGLKGVARRFVAFNGGVGDVQLEWLRNQLEEVRQSGGKAIILSHQPILPASSSPVCLVWNYRELLACLREFADVVVASFAGHAHKGGYRRDRSGIHFRVFEAALENPHPHKTYAIVDVFDDRLVVKGFGNCKSAVYDFDHTVRSSERERPTESSRTGPP